MAPMARGLQALTSPVELRSAYQPVVSLSTATPIGYEALARWPALGVTPAEAFDGVDRHDLAALDWACQAAALQGALDAEVGTSLFVFVNAEPTTFASAPPPALAALYRRARRELRVIIEITERALTDRPAELLAACRAIRAHGWGVALDDVGAVPESLALLPFINPDVIKLDLSVVHSVPDAAQAQIVTAVMAHAERTGAVLLAEGIETGAQLERSLTLGATLGQGLLFGAPEPLPPAGTASRKGRAGLPVHIGVAKPEPPPQTPFALFEGSSRVRSGRRGILVGISRHLEQQAMDLRVPPVVLSSFQVAGRFGPALQDRYALMAASCPLVAVFAEEMICEPVGRVRGAALGASDPLRREWCVVVVGAQYASALIARAVPGRAGSGEEQRFDFVVTHDRPQVIAAALSLLARVAPEPELTAHSLRD